MRIIIFSILSCLMCSLVLAQGEIAPNDVKIYIGADQQIPELREVHFSTENESLIDWEELEEKDYLDFQKWKIERQLKDENPLWKQNLQETRLTEKMGYVIDCVGECRNYRGLGYAKMRYLSTLMEGDEIFTMKESYLWIYLLDGTLVRMSPESSITLKEINRGKTENMIYARLNTGNILWWSRSDNHFVSKDHKETDSLFLPLDMYEANAKTKRFKVDEDDLYSYLQADTNKAQKYIKLNQLIDKSNELASFPTRAFLSFPNGSVYGKNIVAEFVILNGNHSYFKSRTKEQQGLEGEYPENEMSFFYRGFNNTTETPIESGKWYRVGTKGRTLDEEEEMRFSMGEFLTTNIPTIMIARELMYQKYSDFMHDPNLTDLQLADGKGYRLWGDVNEPNSDFDQRIRFLKEYTRRIETTNLLVTERFNKKLKEKGEEVLNAEYSAKYFSRAIAHFYNYRDGVTILSNTKEVLNSERKELWKRIHEKR